MISTLRVGEIPLCGMKSLCDEIRLDGGRVVLGHCSGCGGLKFSEYRK